MAMGKDNKALKKKLRASAINSSLKIEKQSWLRSQLKSLAENPLVALATLILLVVGISDLVFAPLIKPTVELTGNDPASIFAFPFGVRNKSDWFNLYDISWKCLVGKLVKDAPDSKYTVSNSFVRFHSEFYIPPGEVGNYHCSHFIDGTYTKSANVDVEIGYTMWHLWPRSVTKRFVWAADGSNSRWIEGSEIN